MIDSITLITGNEGKAREYSTLLGIQVEAVKADLIEVQSLDVVDVVTRKAEDAYAKLQRPVLVDDTGLSLTAWNGFPGALVAWCLSSVGPEGILEWAAAATDRSATVTTAIGYADADGVQVFIGSLNGTIATERRGGGGFGYDSIFVPDNSGLTFAEMSADQKNAISHRRLAVDKLREVLEKPEEPTYVVLEINRRHEADALVAALNRGEVLTTLGGQAVQARAPYMGAYNPVEEECEGADRG
ncbi:non-canonical purine NTP pyrophosphatase [Kutzneria chonburiensis]|uniref:Non-canonical purine NTP pyrophosphatase n=1 Tax=Kutzneria chonburiensis TaxID=1483604 RepID=A0ABV6N3B9_9PSEU|nr:non-canonical purine NTP pyrophosphatase [Kutzneria chonburiensis]